MPKLLVVDDERGSRESLRLIFSREYDVLLAANADEALALLSREPVDLVLLDVMMTNKSEGFDIARSLQRDTKTAKIPIILITGIRKEMNLPFNFEPDNNWLPVKKVLEKPVKPDQLLKAIEEAAGIGAE